MKKTQNGFVLVSVLLITTISTIYAFSEIKGNKLQERIGGNQQKEMNARLLAEKGMFESYAFMGSDPVGGITSDALNAYVQAAMVASGVEGEVEIKDFNLPLSNRYNFTSKGIYHGAIAYMNAEVEVTHGGVVVTPHNAIVGCEGVTVNNGGRVNSFNTPTYDFDNPPPETNNAQVSTVTEGADIILDGGVTIGGDVNSTGRIDVPIGSTGNVIGNLAANESIHLNTGTITGDITTGQNLTLGDGIVTGNVSAKDNLIQPFDTASIGEEVKAGGYTPPAWSDEAFTHSIKDKATAPGVVAGVSPDVAIEECDKWNIVAGVEANAAAAAVAVAANEEAVLTNMGVSRSGEGLSLAIGETSGAFYREADNNTATPNVHAQDLNVLGEDKKVYVFDKLDVNNITMTITGNVTFLVRGEFSSMENGGTFLMGDNKSTLTILAEGQVNIGGSSDLFSGNGLNEYNKAPLTIKSSYDSDLNGGANAINFTGAAKSYAVIDAPLGHVSAQNGSALIGAIRGKTVTATGAGGILFDESLLGLEEPDPDLPKSIKYLSVAYFYNKN